MRSLLSLFLGVAMSAVSFGDYYLAQEDEVIYGENVVIHYGWGGSQGQDTAGASTETTTAKTAAWNKRNIRLEEKTDCVDRQDECVSARNAKYLEICDYQGDTTALMAEWYAACDKEDEALTQESWGDAYDSLNLIAADAALDSGNNATGNAKFDYYADAIRTYKRSKVYDEKAAAQYTPAWQKYNTAKAMFNAIDVP